MYFKDIILKNVGPIEELSYNFPFVDNGKPKPLILVGTNGSGKSIFLSHLLNLLMTAQGIVFDDAEVERGKVYKFRSPQYIRNGSSYSYAKVSFGPDFSYYEWQLNCSREDHERQFGTPDIDDSFTQIPSHEASFFNAPFTNNPIEITKLFSTNCVLYFPANRFEQPAWLNKYNLKAIAEFEERSTIKGVSNRQIIQESPLAISKNWLMDILLDRATYDMKIQRITLPINETKEHQQEALALPVFIGYQGNAAKIWDLTAQLIKLILRTNENARFGIGPRQNRSVAVLQGDKQLIPNIFQLSTGQTSILNIVLSILRDFDLSGATFENLDDIQGVVIIDEVDAHLHADLQCNLLPTIIGMFPKIQFILTTHSPLFLLGIKAKFGEDGFDVLSLPTGRRIGIEKFEEFQSAFEFYQQADVFRRKVQAEIEQSNKPAIFVEGDYDIDYLKKAALLLDQTELIDQIVLFDGEGFGNLDKIWKNWDNRLPMAFPRLVGLIYDCDTNKTEQDRHLIKKRVIPSIPDNPISKGIENLFPVDLINRLRASHPQFFDITPEVTKIVRGVSVIQAETCEINKSEKRNLCNWLCEHGTADDFIHFGSAFAKIAEIVGIANDQNATSATTDDVIPPLQLSDKNPAAPESVADISN